MVTKYVALYDVGYDEQTRQVTPRPQDESEAYKAVVLDGNVYVVERTPVASSFESGVLVGVEAIRESEDAEWMRLALAACATDDNEDVRLNKDGVVTAAVPAWHDPRIDTPPLGVLMKLLTEGGREIEGYWRDDGGFIAWCPKLRLPEWAKKEIQKRYFANTSFASKVTG